MPVKKPMATETTDIVVKAARPNRISAASVAEPVALRAQFARVSTGIGSTAFIRPQGRVGRASQVPIMRH